ncbi:MAG: cell division protein FtsZ [Hyphomonas sp.]|uniref:cell division protein FtsZ n=1 Tax=Hyphomonas sp. TaxID=87 RepID=UPI0017F4F6CD|nr:cell division protein FtsZ [Hyphomonas sp.]MBU3919592.1 cell division protein FtsZ [Alphaproteobacteria bacterium]MBA3068425.1 cell division protein FtsZ [Hyphomonas sp.]MBU4060707.1 cell division protein FtsZ [Alphaproteobacteria bacterium]MBU4164691.1 cell division protein FtsZ [Alphaproteobacteria bacterium]MBU4567812.1 cell division protein FtsZ [Alphaproteobacteria bacterium]
MTQELKPRILVFGVGGAGGNAINNMIEANLQGVEFIVANTDAQALSRSRAESCLQLGIGTTSGLGAGARPEIGARAAEESIDEIRARLEGAHMVFIAAGMGGGTGTGAAPIIARAAQEMGILTIAVITKPFGFEGAHRMRLAEDGLSRIRGHVDTMIVVPNQNLFRIANDKTTFADAFRMADDVLYSGVRGITDLIVMPGLINLDFADVSAIMRGMGTALMGMGEATGEGRALEAARRAIDNPLLDDITIKGARGVLVNITGGYDMTLFELDEAANEIRREVDPNANIILGSAFDPQLEGRIRVSVVAAGLDAAARRLPVAQPILQRPVEAEPADLETEAGDIAAMDDAEDDPNDVAEEAVAFEAGGQDDSADERPRVVTPPRHVAAPAVPAAAVFSERTDAPAPDRPARDGAPASSGFANLFGWRRPAPQGQNDTDPAPHGALPASPIISSPDDHPEPAAFDDADLEIPAFLRRSANH